jgi:hypothetical protein
MPLPSRRGRLRWIGPALLLAGASCEGSGEAPRDVADRFMDLHYVVLDQAGALEITSGLAREKVRDEIRLLGDVRSGAELSASRPRISYAFLQRSDLDDGGERWRYRLEIKAGEGIAIARDVFLTLRRDAAGWRVANFVEMESAGGPTGG